MPSFLSSLNLSPFTLVAIGLVVLAVAIVLLVVWVIAIDRRTRGVVDGLEVERRKVAEMQVIVSQRVGRGAGQRSQGRPAPGSRGAAAARPQGAGPAPARTQNPGASRVGVPQSAEMGSQRVRAAQPAAAAQARPAAARPAAQSTPALTEDEQAFAAWVQERAQAMENQGRARSARGRAANAGVAQPAPQPSGRGARPARAARGGQDPHAISVPRGVDKTGGVPMEQWTGPVGRPRAAAQRGQVARQATAAAQAQTGRDPRAEQSRARVEEAARAQRAAAVQAQRQQGAQPARDPRAEARAAVQADPRGGQARAGAAVDPRAQRTRAAQADPRAARPAGADPRAQRAAAQARDPRAQRAAAQQPRPGRAGDSRPWQNPRASARQASPTRGGRGGNPAASGYVQVDAPASRQPHSYAQGAPSSPLQPRDSRRPLTQPHPTRPAAEDPIPVQVEAASSVGLFRRKKDDASPRGKHAR